MSKIIKEIQFFIKENIWHLRNNNRHISYQSQLTTLQHKIIHKYQIHSKNIQKLYIIAEYLNKEQLIDSINIENNILKFHHHEYLNS